jgi:hypothetical protein
MDDFRQTNWVAVNAMRIDREMVRRLNLRVAGGLGGAAFVRDLHQWPHLQGLLDLSPNHEAS